MGESTLKGNYQNVRLWLKADLPPPEIEVCSSPNFGHFRGLG